MPALVHTSRLGPAAAAGITGLAASKDLKASLVEQLAEAVDRQFLLVLRNGRSELFPCRETGDLGRNGRNRRLGGWRDCGQRGRAVVELDDQPLGFEQALEALTKVVSERISEEDARSGSHFFQSSDFPTRQGLLA